MQCSVCCVLVAIAGPGLVLPVELIFDTLWLVLKNIQPGERGGGCRRWVHRCGSLSVQAQYECSV